MCTVIIVGIRMHNKYTNYRQISAILEYLINIFRKIYPPYHSIYILSAIIICVIQ